jgi:hypothetical protein
MSTSAIPSDIIPVAAHWLAYVTCIRRYAEGFTAGRPNLDPVMREVVLENLREVNRQLLFLQPRGVVTKIKLPCKSPSSTLWREFDRYLKRRALRRNPGYQPWALPLQATKDAFQRNPVVAFLEHDGKYEHTRNADVHHIWPETLGGPSIGWNLVPLPPFQHHDVLHPVLDHIVRESPEGQRFQLV